MVAKKPSKYIAVNSENKKYQITPLSESEIKINGKKGEYKIDHNKDGITFITLNKKKFMIDIVEKYQNQYIVSVDGVYYSMSVETPISLKRRSILKKGNTKSKLEAVKAPMPGKIITVLAEPDSYVIEGSPLYVLEAMKMQNEIASSVSGKIKDVLVKENQAVMKDDVILEIIKDK